MLIIDAHLDLSMNALEWNRDFTRPISEIRERERGMTDKPDRGRGTVCFPEMRRFIGECRYPDCRHVTEPKCAVRGAVARGEIAPDRIESYHVLLAELESEPEEWE